MEGAGVQICRTVRRHVTAAVVFYKGPAAAILTGHLRSSRARLQLPALPLRIHANLLTFQSGAQQIRIQVGTPGLRSLDPFLMLDELKLPANQ